MNNRIYLPSGNEDGLTYADIKQGEIFKYTYTDGDTWYMKITEQDCVHFKTGTVYNPLADIKVLRLGYGKAITIVQQA